YFLPLYSCTSARLSSISIPQTGSTGILRFVCYLYLKLTIMPIISLSNQKIHFHQVLVWTLLPNSHSHVLVISAQLVVQSRLELILQIVLLYARAWINYQIREEHLVLVILLALMERS